MAEIDITRSRRASKSPVKGSEDLPSCFGLSYQEADTLCRGCSVVMRCKPETANWADIVSVAEALHRLDKTTYVPEKDQTGMDSVYSRIYERHFGRPPSQKSVTSKAARGSFRNATKFCEENKVKPEIFITAQMRGMRDRPSHIFVKYGFQPGMLCGKGAMVRYNIYVRVTKRRYGRTTEGMLDQHTPAAHFINELAGDEYLVASNYVAGKLKDGTMSWKDAIDDGEPRINWLTLDGYMAGKEEVAGLFMDLERKFAKEFLVRAKEIATLRATSVIAEQYQLGLAARIGYKGIFSWESFTVLLRRLFKCCEQPESVDLSDMVGGTDMAGMLWGGGL